MSCTRSKYDGIKTYEELCHVPHIMWQLVMPNGQRYGMTILGSPTSKHVRVVATNMIESYMAIKKKVKCSEGIDNTN